MAPRFLTLPLMAKPIPETTDEKLDEMLIHLRKMDSRDRLRTWGGFFRGLIGIVPIVLFILGSWYLYENSDEVLTKIATEAATQAAKATQQSTQGILDQLKNFQQ